MKTSLSAVALAAVLMAGSALAADLPLKGLPPLPPPPPAPLWSGFYVGLNAGYTWNESALVNNAGGFLFSNTAGLNNPGAFAVGNALAASSGFSTPLRNDGFIGGGQFGFNIQLSPSFVAGIEADIQGIAGSDQSAGASKITSLAPWGFPAESYASGISVAKSLDYLGTVRGRVGFLVTPTLLVFGSGGLAYGGVNLRTAFVAQESLGAGVYPAVLGGSSYSDTRVGWTAGGGVEWLLHPNWSAKVEYLYYDLGTVTTPGSLLLQTTAFGGGFIPWGAAVSSSSARIDGHIVRAGLNYHFNFAPPAPVVAKY
jgi:outer membrane immunogenic protein